ncbi:MAG: DUF2269 family protein [Candidatus Krumholzibacteriia bacterium]
MDQIMRTLHHLGAILFVGNLIISFHWKVRADRSRDRRVIAEAHRSVGATDSMFAATGAVLILLTGLHQSARYGVHLLFTSLWLGGGSLLFVLAVMVWLIGMQRSLRRQRALVAAAAPSDAVPDAYWPAARRWYVMGIVAMALPIVSLILMVFKPHV